MGEWNDILDHINATLASTTSNAFFRGHRDASWPLFPTLARCQPTSKARRIFQSDALREKATYRRFVVAAGNLLPSSEDVWSNIFAMQHHGMPTRLLDWTSTFGVALHFAVAATSTDAAVWILNPYNLNAQTIGRNEVLDPEDLVSDYVGYFIDQTHKLEGDVVALRPPRRHPRLFNQRSGFTLHNGLETPLEDTAPSALTKIVIPLAAHKDAHQFLRLTGISEFSLFPDLDGLSREFRADYF